MTTKEPISSFRMNIRIVAIVALLCAIVSGATARISFGDDGLHLERAVVVLLVFHFTTVIFPALCGPLLYCVFRATGTVRSTSMDWVTWVLQGIAWWIVVVGWWQKQFGFRLTPLPAVGAAAATIMAIPIATWFIGLILEKLLLRFERQVTLSPAVWISGAIGMLHLAALSYAIGTTGLPL
jgi:hypothetical protein